MSTSNSVLIIRLPIPANDCDSEGVETAGLITQPENFT